MFVVSATRGADLRACRHIPAAVSRGRNGGILPEADTMRRGVVARDLETLPLAD